MTKAKIAQVIKKKRGYEQIIIDNNKNYCGKVMKFPPNTSTSLHSHSLKEETFYCLSGEIKVVLTDIMGYEPKEIYLYEGDKLKIKQYQTHQIINESNEEAILIEVSTQDFDNDSIRLATDYAK